MRLFDPDTWHEVMHGLLRHRLRTLLTGFGVLWGMFMLVVMVAFGRGLHEGAMRSLGEYTAETVWMWPERTTMAHAGHGPGRVLTIRVDDLPALERGVPGLAALSPRNHLGLGDEAPIPVTRGSRHGSFSVTGEDFDVASMRPIVVERGRWMSPTDVQERRKVAFLGAKVHAQLFSPDEPVVGERIVVGGVELTVGGVFRLQHKGAAAEQQESGIILPWTTLARTYGPRDRVGAVAMLAEPGTDPLAMAAAARGVLGRRHQVHPDDRVAFDTWTSHEDAARFESLFGAIAGLTWIVGGFTLFAAALGVGNVMLVAVRERTQEIGIRKALGATTSAIVGDVVLETMTLTLVFGYLGLVAGVLFVDVAAGVLASLPPEEQPTMLASPRVDFTVALAGLGLLCAAGLGVSSMPARAAAAVQPVVALQTE